MTGLEHCTSVGERHCQWVDHRDMGGDHNAGKHINPIPTTYTWRDMLGTRIGQRNSMVLHTTQVIRFCKAKLSLEGWVVILREVLQWDLLQQWLLCLKILYSSVMLFLSVWLVWSVSNYKRWPFCFMVGKRGWCYWPLSRPRQIIFSQGRGFIMVVFRL